jgi:hypothetical protein
MSAHATAGQHDEPGADGYGEKRSRSWATYGKGPSRSRAGRIANMQ